MAGKRITVVISQAQSKNPARRQLEEEIATGLMLGGDAATELYTIDSGVEGPTVMIVAGIHGNETAPPQAAAQLLLREPKRGRLIIVPRMNR